MMISDETGEGKMTVHQILPGIMICFTDMHMELATSLDAALERAYAIEGVDAKVTVIPDGLGVIVK